MMYKKNLLSNIISFVDFTSLNHQNNQIANIASLCDLLIKNKLSIASICIDKKFIPNVKNYINDLGLNIQIASIANLDMENKNSQDLVTNIKEIIDLGANEIDVFFPYYKLKEYKLSEVQQFLRNIRRSSINQVLKVTIENLSPHEEKFIRLACNLCLDTGVDFIHTSNEKLDFGASLQVSQIILTELYNNKSYSCGFKISGEITTLQQAESYTAIAETIMGDTFLTPHKFRIGSSILLNNYLVKKN